MAYGRKWEAEDGRSDTISLTVNPSMKKSIIESAS